MHVTKLNVQKKQKKKQQEQRMKKSQQECQAKLSTSIVNTSTHIKTPIMSSIVTKPTEWQVRPAIVARLTDLTFHPDWALR